MTRTATKVAASPSDPGDPTPAPAPRQKRARTNVTETIRLLGTDYAYTIDDVKTALDEKGDDPTAAADWLVHHPRKTRITVHFTADRDLRELRPPFRGWVLRNANPKEKPSILRDPIHGYFTLKHQQGHLAVTRLTVVPHGCHKGFDHQTRVVNPGEHEDILDAPISPDGADVYIHTGADVRKWQYRRHMAMALCNPATHSSWWPCEWRRLIGTAFSDAFSEFVKAVPDKRLLKWLFAGKCHPIICDPSSANKRIMEQWKQHPIADVQRKMGAWVKEREQKKLMRGGTGAGLTPLPPVLARHSWFWQGDHGDWRPFDADSSTVLDCAHAAFNACKGRSTEYPLTIAASSSAHSREYTVRFLPDGEHASHVVNGHERWSNVVQMQTKTGFGRCVWRCALDETPTSDAGATDPSEVSKSTAYVRHNGVPCLPSVLDALSAQVSHAHALFTAPSRQVVAVDRSTLEGKAQWAYVEGRLNERDPTHAKDAVKKELVSLHRISDAFFEHYTRLHDAASAARGRSRCTRVSAIHGTRNMHPLKMVEDSEGGAVLDIRKCKEQGYWGQSIYCSLSADYQDQRGYKFMTKQGGACVFLCDILIGTPEGQVRNSMHSKTGVLDVSDGTKCDTVAIVNDGWQSYVMWENSRVIPMYVCEYNAIHIK